MTRVEQLRARLLGFQPTDTLWGWLGPLFFAAVGGLMRFWALDRPHQLVFDETYYVKQGYSMIEYGVEMRVPDTIKKPDELFTHGTPDVFGSVGDGLANVGGGFFDVLDGVGHDRHTITVAHVALLGALSIKTGRCYTDIDDRGTGHAPPIASAATAMV